MSKMYKKFIATIMTTMIMTTTFSSSIFAFNEKAQINTINEGSLELELSPEEVRELHNNFPEDVHFSDEEIDKRLIEAGEFTQEELDKINAEYDSEVISSRSARAIKYINGYNKYRTFKENGKDNLYVYINGKTLKKIQNGATLTAALGGFLPAGQILKVSVVAISTVLGIKLSGINTSYGIVLKFVKDKWVHQGATYIYRYNGWFYQT
jgi:hypothetical protein